MHAWFIDISEYRLIDCRRQVVYCIIFNFSEYKVMLAGLFWFRIVVEKIENYEFL